jgi:hypothetical protein
MKIFYETVSSMVYSLAPVNLNLSANAKNQAVRFVLRQHSRMPVFLKIPIAMMTMYFDIVCVFRNGAFFHNLPPQKRITIIKHCKTSSLRVFRDFIQFYESLVVLYCYSICQPAAGVKSKRFKMLNGQLLQRASL